MRIVSFLQDFKNWRYKKQHFLTAFTVLNTFVRIANNIFSFRQFWRKLAPASWSHETFYPFRQKFFRQSHQIHLLLLQDLNKQPSSHFIEKNNDLIIGGTQPRLWKKRSRNFYILIDRNVEKWFGDVLSTSVWFCLSDPFLDDAGKDTYYSKSAFM